MENEYVKLAFAFRGIISKAKKLIKRPPVDGGARAQYSGKAAGAEIQKFIDSGRARTFQGASVFGGPSTPTRRERIMSKIRGTVPAVSNKAKLNRAVQHYRSTGQT